MCEKKAVISFQSLVWRQGATSHLTANPTVRGKPRAFLPNTCMFFFPQINMKMMPGYATNDFWNVRSHGEGFQSNPLTRKWWTPRRELSLMRNSEPLPSNYTLSRVTTGFIYLPILADQSLQNLINLLNFCYENCCENRQTVCMMKLALHSVNDAAFRRLSTLHFLSLFHPLRLIKFYLWLRC